MKEIYCCSCEKDVLAKQITGDVAYPNSLKLYTKKFWQCSACLCFVGCHPSGKPLGVIPTKQMRKLRSEIHGWIDDLWKKQICSRGKIYSKMSELMGVEEFHTAKLKTIAEHYQALECAKKLDKQIKGY